MAPLAILVEFTVGRGFAEQFHELILANARVSLRDEAGCRRFDVLAPPGDADHVILYEIYDDDGAFDLHLRSPHYQTFAAAAEDLIETRSVRRLGFLGPGIAAGVGG